jgi:hypothetical protein
VSSSGTIALSKIWAMLDHCAPGHSREQRTHNWIIKYLNHTFHRLPVGEHGARKDPEIQVGHVKQMVRLFEIMDCARSQIDRLRC